MMILQKLQRSIGDFLLYSVCVFFCPESFEFAQKRIYSGTSVGRVSGYRRCLYMGGVLYYKYT